MGNKKSRSYVPNYYGKDNFSIEIVEEDFQSVILYKIEEVLDKVKAILNKTLPLDKVGVSASNLKALNGKPGIFIYTLPAYKVCRNNGLPWSNGKFIAIESILRSDYDESNNAKLIAQELLGKLDQAEIKIVKKEE